jgi:hypothetical protein
MLSERDRELLTAYVDGEMSTRQRKLLVRLLHKSPGARALLQELQANAGLLRALPRRKLDDTFTHLVMTAIAERGVPLPRPAVAAIRPRSARWATWGSWAAAAAVLVAVGAGGYFSFPLLQTNDRHKNTQAAKDGTSVPRDNREIAKNDGSRAPEGQGKRDIVVTPPKKNSVEAMVNADKRPSQDKKSTEVVKKSDAPKKGISKEIEPKREDVGVQAAPSNPDPLQVSDPNLSVMMPLHDVEKQQSHDRLLTKLKKDSAFHIQMLCRDTGKSLERLRTVLAANKIQLVIDEPVLARLKNPKLRTTFLIYAENLKPEELVTIFEQLGAADRKAATSRGPEQFGYFVVNAMSPKLRQQIAKFLDVPPGRSAKSKVPLGVDVRKPVGEGTADEVERKLKERELARTNVQPAKSGVRQMLVLAYNEDKTPVDPRAAHSKPVKQFRENRAERQPGTLQMVLVLSRDNV